MGLYDFPGDEQADGLAHIEQVLPVSVIEAWWSAAMISPPWESQKKSKGAFCTIYPEIFSCISGLSPKPFECFFDMRLPLHHI